MLPDLKTAFLDLLKELETTEIKPILGGGYGIFLRMERIRETGARTLIEKRPVPRATNDLDLFLRPELLIDSAKLAPLKTVLEKLGYSVVPGAQNYQFFSPVDSTGENTGGIKIDLLTSDKSKFAGTVVKVDARRARPKPSVGIHAHPTEEAFSLEDSLSTVGLAGKLSSGDEWKADIFIPHPFTFLIMKLYAFRDRLNDPAKDYGGYHALDLYSILSTTTEAEWKTSKALREKWKEHPRFIEAGDIVSEHFSDQNSTGVLRIRESRYYSDDFQLGLFISVLDELFR